MTGNFILEMFNSEFNEWLAVEAHAEEADAVAGIARRTLRSPDCSYRVVKGGC